MAFGHTKLVLRWTKHASFQSPAPWRASSSTLPSLQHMPSRSYSSNSRPLHSPCSRIRSPSFLLSTWSKTQVPSFSTSSPRPKAKTIQQLKARASTGPFSWKAAALFVATGVAMIFYFRYEKARLERKRVVEMSKGVGKPKVGGPFVLKDLDGNEFTEEKLKGKYSFVGAPIYFSLPFVFYRWAFHERVFLTLQHCSRFISASPIVQISAQTNSTKWPR